MSIEVGLISLGDRKLICESVKAQLEKERVQAVKNGDQSIVSEIDKKLSSLDELYLLNEV